MPKRKCPHCKAYKDRDKMIILNNRAFCNLDHAIEHGRINAHKGAEKRKQKQRKEDNKRLRQEDTKRKAEKKKHRENDRPYQFKLTKQAVQRWVNKVRDHGKGCISCGTKKQNIQYCGGHFKTAGGYPERALWSPNIMRQCNQYCNLHLSGNIEGTKTTRGYKNGIIKRHGDDHLEYLEQHREFNKLTCQDLILIRKGYLKLIRENDSDDFHLRAIITKGAQNV